MFAGQSAARCPLRRVGDDPEDPQSALAGLEDDGVSRTPVEREAPRLDRRPVDVQRDPSRAAVADHVQLGLAFEVALPQHLVATAQTDAVARRTGRRLCGRRPDETARAERQSGAGFPEDQSTRHPRARVPSPEHRTDLRGCTRGTCRLEAQVSRRFRLQRVISRVILSLPGVHRCSYCFDEHPPALHRDLEVPHPALRAIETDLGPCAAGPRRRPGSSAAARAATALPGRIRKNMSAGARRWDPRQPDHRSL